MIFFRTIIYSFFSITFFWPILYSLINNDHIKYKFLSAGKYYELEVIIKHGIADVLLTRKDEHGSIKNISSANSRVFRISDDKFIAYTYQLKSVVGSSQFGPDWVRDNYWVGNFVPVRFDDEGKTLSFYSYTIRDTINAEIICRGNDCMN